MSQLDPKIIQGGMGAGISSWLLAKEVARAGQLGVVSGTCLDSILIRKLQNGDDRDSLQRAMNAFPIQEMVQKIDQRYFSSSSETLKRYQRSSMLTAKPSTRLQELLMVSNFVEVFLAKEGHSGLVGINYLEKIQMATLPSIYGAMLAGVDYILMGAGIPKEIPGVIDKLSRHENVELKLQVEGASVQDHFSTVFSPAKMTQEKLSSSLKRPKFLAIVSSSTLALTLARKSTGKIDGFVVEGASAGGHNAPPRGTLQLNKLGEPIYGPRDDANLEIIRQIGLPFWLAGSYGNPEGLQKALALGATGIQVGTPFALCKESGLSQDLKTYLLTQAKHDRVDVFTDPVASPTGFPFKIAKIPGTISESEIYQERPRKCDLGYLRKPYKKEDGTLGYRCPAEPVKDYVAKGGKIEDTHGRKCLCNALLANIDLAQYQKNDYHEKPLVTIGENIHEVTQFMKDGDLFYSANDVIQTLLNR